MPEKGSNAIYKAARAVSILENHPFDAAPHPLMGQATLNVGTISGGLNVNSVPDETRIGIDIRTTPNLAYGTPPMILLGSGEPQMAHQTDEYCLIDRIEQAVAAYEEIARRWCGV